ncbi:MAG: hemin receptor [Porticoccaceae bacterium]|nr:hemin receptor [Porticoccaceae bacterium]
MNEETIVTVQSTFSKVAPISEQAAALFYGRLFELDPSLKPLFKGDMREQGIKLMKMLAIAVNSLRDPDTLIPAVENLGVRHIDYGVEDSHYDTVGAALLWTLGQGLGDDFTPDVEAAWTEVYGTLASVMKTAAQKAA